MAPRRVEARALVLARPDGHVAWRGDAALAEPLPWCVGPGACPRPV